MFVCCSVRCPLDVVKLCGIWSTLNIKHKLFTTCCWLILVLPFCSGVYKNRGKPTDCLRCMCITSLSGWSVPCSSQAQWWGSLDCRFPDLSPFLKSGSGSPFPITEDIPVICGFFFFSLQFPGMHVVWPPCTLYTQSCEVVSDMLCSYRGWDFTPPTPI